MKEIQLNHPPSGRILWLTDTYGDHNGVSMVLQSMHKEIVSRNLPIDILVCSHVIQSEPNLLVVKPLTEFSVPFYAQQQIRVPGFFEIKKIFLEGGYDRIVCSTEGPMGMAALYLRKSCHVKAYFYIHTDWLTFAQTAMKMGDPGISGVTHLLRRYYKGYDGLFVLNTDQQEWLTGKSMRIDASRVFLTAHWAEGIFYPRKVLKSDVFGLTEETPVLLYAGRLSTEKGIMELPRIYREVLQFHPGLKMVVTGNGPASEKLKEIFPEAIYTGWIDHDELPNIFSASDLLILPSRFDTFSCVVLEAMNCGLPVIAYNTKGPKDIIRNRVNGFLVSDRQEMSHEIKLFLSDAEVQKSMRQEARERGESYNVRIILEDFLSNVGIIQAV